MGAGLSMASVNKIKELANSREYSLALELVEHQDLTKSLNPQFLRLCGEIYIQNDRYVDARRCLIMAHRLGPESKRIMFVFVELYLRMGYFELAKTYYDMYMFDATKSDSRQMEYIWMKHEHPQDYESMERLLDIYSHNLDYDWSFELYLLYEKAGKEKEAKILADIYRATYKNSENSECIDRMERGTTSVDELFDLYAREACADDRAEEETLRIEEKELLEADNLRMHPKEAEITVMYEDALTPAESEKKVQKLLKKQDKEEERKEKKLLKKQKQQEKKIEKQNAKSALEEAKPEPEAESGEEEAKPEPEAEGGKEEAKPEAESGKEEAKTEDVDVEKSETVPAVQEEKTEPNPEADNMDEISNEKRKGFFHRLFRKKKNEEDELSGETVTEQKSDKKINDEVDTSSDSEIKQEIVEQTAEHSTIEQTVEHANAQQIENNIDTKIAERTEDMGQNRKTIANNVVIVEDDDDFEAQADTVEELAAKSKEEKKPTSPVKNEKPVFEFQTMELAPEDFDDQYEVDDFTEKLDDEFGEMNAYESKSETVEEEPEAVEAEPEVIEEEIKEEPEAVEAEPEVIEEETEEESEVVEAEPEMVEEEPEVVEGEPEMVEEETEVVEAEPVTVEEEPEVVEAELETVEEEPEVVEAEPEVIEEETEEESEVVEAEPETVEEEPEVVEAEPGMVEEEPEVVEAEPETVEEEPGVIEEEPETVEEESEAIEEEPETVEEEAEFHVAPFTTKPKKKKLDFPEFKSSLFPDYHKEMKEVENNFDEIMEEAQDKMTENMRKEAQMQKEAEALLASLGISLDSIPTPKTVQKETQPEQKGPSRDELKASLKIDTNKKNLLKQIKEYR